jgi:hypothetical protein
LVTTENTIEVEGQSKPALVANTLVMAMPQGRPERRIRTRAARE